ncbi:uncharacterized protein ACRADG_005003 [Cochliomyia hominivorax]
MFGANNKRKLKKQIKKKRLTSERKLVVLNEEELIRQVCMRPIIYDRSLKGNRKTSLRNQCWEEISEAMDATIEECRTRWRSLRDTFTKHYKISQRADGKVANKQSKWLFYDKMMFLIPHVEGVSSELLDEICDNSEDAQSINCEPLVLNDANLNENDHTMQSVNNLEEHNKNSNTIMEQNVIETSPSTLNTSKYDSNNHNSTTSVLYTEKCAEFLDSHEKFLLSCAPILRRLTHKQNALARLKIQQILYDIEFKQEYD